MTPAPRSGRILAGGGAHDIVVGGSWENSNTFENVWDDAWQMLGNEYRQEFSYNRCYGAGPSMDQAGSRNASPDPGKLFIHHNIIDVTKHHVFWGRDGCKEDGKTEGNRHAIALSTHGVPTVYSMPRKFYYNTVVSTEMPFAGSNSSYLDMSEFGRGATNHQAPHEVFNNIFKVRKLISPLVDANSGNFIMDGNIYWRPVSGNPHWRFINTSGGLIDGAFPVVMDTVAKLRATQALADSQAYYPPGWEASGLDVDPDLDADYKPRATSVKTGAVDLTGKGWPGTSVHEAHRGAVAP